jgi:hypothetical protein
MTKPAPDGWIAVYAEGGGPTYYVRCREDGEGGVEIVKLLIASQERITSAALRDVPIGRIEATINGSPLLLAAAKSAEKVPDRLVERLRTGPVRSFRDAIGVGGEVPLPGGNEPLKRPDRSDPAAFYGQVALRYLVLVRNTSKPAVAIAEESGVPVATARRWINEARRRGLLPAGRQGRAK